MVVLIILLGIVIIALAVGTVWQILLDEAEQKELERKTFEKIIGENKNDK